jgi:hypothetical protein
MVLIRNKKQNTIWDITDPTHLKRLLADPGSYEEVKAEVKAEPKTEPKKPEKSG